MPEGLYCLSTGATPFTCLTTPQTVLLVQGGSDVAVKLRKYRLSFQGVTASNPSISMRFFTTDEETFGTFTSINLTQIAGRQLNHASGVTCGSNYTVEPTVKTYFAEEILLSPNGGTVIYDYPYGDEMSATPLGLEITASAAVGVMASLFIAFF